MSIDLSEYVLRIDSSESRDIQGLEAIVGKLRSGVFALKEFLKTLFGEYFPGVLVSSLFSFCPNANILNRFTPGVFGSFLGTSSRGLWIEGK